MNKRMKIAITVGKCHMFVLGMDLVCPLCKVLVRSGTQHECQIQEPVPSRKKGKS